MAAPAYDLREFLKACASNPLMVSITKGALDSARIDFAVQTEGSARALVAGFSFEEFTFRNSKPWENFPEGKVVDAYLFSDGAIRGYLSFGRSPKGMKKWIVKSLKKDDSPLRRR